MHVMVHVVMNNNMSTMSMDGEYVDDGATAATPNRNVNRGEDAEVIIDDRRAMIDIDIVVIEVRVRLGKLISYTSNIQSCIIHEFSITV
jgi:hypothetical protein